MFQIEHLAKLRCHSGRACSRFCFGQNLQRSTEFNSFGQNDCRSPAILLAQVVIIQIVKDRNALTRSESAVALGRLTHISYSGNAGRNHDGMSRRVWEDNSVTMLSLLDKPIEISYLRVQLPLTGFTASSEFIASVRHWFTQHFLYFSQEFIAKERPLYDWQPSISPLNMVPWCWESAHIQRSRLRMSCSPAFKFIGSSFIDNFIGQYQVNWKTTIPHDSQCLSRGVSLEHFITMGFQEGDSKAPDGVIKFHDQNRFFTAGKNFFLGPWWDFLWHRRATG